MGMGTGMGTILPSPATRIYVLYNMINNLFIFGVQLINLFNYLSLNLKQLNIVTLPYPSSCVECLSMPTFHCFLAKYYDSNYFLS